VEKHDLRREFGVVSLLPESEGRRRQEEDGGAEAQQPEAQGQREQTCDE